MSRAHGVLCGTPELNCTGSVRLYGGAGARKMHDSHEEAFKCFKRYMQKQGYTCEGHTFKKGDLPILCVTRKSKFGVRLPAGKSGEGVAGKGRMNKPIHSNAVIETGV